MRILIGPLEIAGYYWQLTQGFREIGIRCDFVTLVDHPFGYPTDPPPRLVRLARALEKLSSRRFLTRVAASLRLACIATWFLAALLKYDVIIYAFGKTFLPHYLDVRIAAFFKKTIVVNLGHGSDTRPPYLNGASKHVWVADGHALAETTRRRKELIARWEGLADHIIGSPYSTSQFASRSFVDWFAMGVPSAPRATIPLRIASDLRSRPIRVLHAPSRSRDKGTAEIRMVVESLQRDGIALDYREIQGKPNAVVLEALNWADLVIDQVWSDTPLAGFATEAAQHGCGVLVCGYGLEELEHYVTAPLPPSVIARPENLRDALARLVANPEEILRSGRALQDFVEKQWARDLVAQRWNALIAGEDISSISVDPQSVIYVAGCGAPSAVISAAISATIVEVGPEGLGLENRPDLLAAIAASYSR